MKTNNINFTNAILSKNESHSKKGKHTLIHTKHRNQENNSSGTGRAHRGGWDRRPRPVSMVATHRGSHSLLSELLLVTVEIIKSSPKSKKHTAELNKMLVFVI